MIIETDIGNFGNFKDLLTCMTQEKHDSVEVYKAEYWFANVKFIKDLRLSYSDVQNIVNDFVE